jgi:carboxyl-terminal processing protease
VQTVAQLDQETGVKLTIAQYMTPKNRKIQAVGIMPDVILEEVDKDLFEKNLKEDRYIREKDLKNHLTATIETEEEKKDRLLMEKEDRIRKMKNLEKKKIAKKDDEEELFKVDRPSEDYQVTQAIRHLQGFNVFKEMKKNN